jgi:uncharacterized membrane protein
MNRDRHAATIEAMTTSTRSRAWLLPTGLIALGLIPVAAGAVRATTLATGAQVTPDNQRFFDMPAPVLVHIFGASLYLMLGAFQFVPGFRRRRPRWHRIAGRVLVPCGVAAALSGIWMTLFYDLPDHDSRTLNAIRLGVGSAMAMFLVLGFVAVRRRDFGQHRAWMIRAYAIALGAGSQVWTITLGTAILGPGTTNHTVEMAAAWAINLAVAEWAIRRRRAGRVGDPRARAGRVGDPRGPQ